MEPLTILERNRLPFAELLGIRFVSAAPERVQAEMEVRAELCTTPPVLHGGAVMAFADTLGACATILNLKEGANTTTIESKTNFFAPAPVGSKVTGECTRCIAASARWSGRRGLLPPEGRLLALITQTQMVL